MLDNPIAKALLCVDATGLAFHILMEFDFKGSADHGVKVDALCTDLRKRSSVGVVMPIISLFLPGPRYGKALVNFQLIFPMAEQIGEPINLLKPASSSDMPSRACGATGSY